MSGRYLITREQLGMLQKYFHSTPYHKDSLEVIGMLNTVLGEQFIGNSSQDVKEDAEQIKKLFKEETK